MSFPPLKSQKAQGISINAIIIAAIALVVLVVLFAIFTGRFRIFSTSLNECTASCVARSDCQPPNSILPDKKCKGSTANLQKDTAGDYFVFPTNSQGDRVCCLKLS